MSMNKSNSYARLTKQDIFFTSKLGKKLDLAYGSEDILKDLP